MRLPAGWPASPGWSGIGHWDLRLPFDAELPGTSDLLGCLLRMSLVKHDGEIQCVFEFRCRRIGSDLSDDIAADSGQ
jgi:hypothetical protein